MSIQVSDCDKTSFESNSFDVLTACMAYHHFSDKAGFAREAARILKKGGCLYIADPRFLFLIRKIMNALLKLFRITGKFFTAEELTQDFSRFGFKIENAYFEGIVQVIKLRRVV